MAARPGPPGCVTLVGAGPGDPQLLTLQAVQAIASADVLLVDDLVHEAVLAHARPGARVLRVGKRGGQASTPQAHIGELMLREAHAGRAVVRLKGGDPFIFGRGGEEVQQLRAAGYEPRVVHGITAGLAALGSLGAPLTHGERAHGVIFASGHLHAQAHQPQQQASRWQRMGEAVRDLQLTLVIYMGAGHAAEIQAGLLRALPADTAAAVIERATWPGQRQCVTTLGRLAQAMQAGGLGSPAIVVVGDVVLGAREALRRETEQTEQGQAVAAG